MFFSTTILDAVFNASCIIQKRVLRNLKELQSLGMDFVFLREEYEKEVLDFLEELDIFVVT